MIHIIGTAHRTQYWSDAIRQNKSIDTCAAIVGRFEKLLAGFCHFTQCHGNR